MKRGEESSSRCWTASGAIGSLNTLFENFPACFGGMRSTTASRSGLCGVGCDERMRRGKDTQDRKRVSSDAALDDLADEQGHPLGPRHDLVVPCLGRAR